MEVFCGKELLKYFEIDWIGWEKRGGKLVQNEIDMQKWWMQSDVILCWQWVVKIKNGWRDEAKRVNYCLVGFRQSWINNLKFLRPSKSVAPVFSWKKRNNHVKSRINTHTHTLNKPDFDQSRQNEKKIKFFNINNFDRRKANCWTLFRHNWPLNQTSRRTLRSRFRLVEFEILFLKNRMLIRSNSLCLSLFHTLSLVERWMNIVWIKAKSFQTNTNSGANISFGEKIEQNVIKTSQSKLKKCFNPFQPLVCTLHHTPPHTTHVCTLKSVERKNECHKVNSQGMKLMTRRSSSSERKKVTFVAKVSFLLTRGFLKRETEWLNDRRAWTSQ